MTATSDQPKENPVQPPTPAERIVIHKVKNGWTLDVDHAATRWQGDCCSVPGYVYTTLTRLASDVMTFLRIGKPADHDFLDPKLEVNVKAKQCGKEAEQLARDAYTSGHFTGYFAARADDVCGVWSQDELRRLKQEAYIAGRESRNEDVTIAEQKGFDRGHAKGYNLCCEDQTSEVRKLRDELSKVNQVLANMLGQRDAAIVVGNQLAKERDEAVSQNRPEHLLWHKTKIQQLTKERDEAVDLSNQSLNQRDVARTERDIAVKERTAATKDSLKSWAKVRNLESILSERPTIHEASNAAIDEAYCRGRVEGVSSEHNRFREAAVEANEKLCLKENALRAHRDEFDKLTRELGESNRVRSELCSTVARLEREGGKAWWAGHTAGIASVMAQVKKISDEICSNLGGAK